MSYCALLIITKEPLDPDALERLLDPWMGEQLPDEVPPLRHVDVTDDLRRIYGRSRRWRVTSADGACLRADDDRLYREPTEEERVRLGTRPADDGDRTVFWRDWGDGRGLRPKVWCLPQGWTQRMVPLADVMTFHEFVADVTQASMLRETRDDEKDYGRLNVDATGASLRVLRADRTYPRGGYWKLGPTAPCLLFKLKEGEEAARLLVDANEPPEPGFAYQALLEEIDFGGMRDKAALEAAAEWDGIRSVIGSDAVWLTRDQVRFRHGFDHEQDEAFYSSQPAVQNAIAAGLSSWSIDVYRGSREDHIARARRRVLSPDAVLKDDLWIYDHHGWFDIARDEQEGGGWTEQIAALLDGLPPETCLTYVRYHL